MTKQAVATALLGCGRIGGLHAQTLSALEECRLVKVCDTDREAAKKVAKKVEQKVEQSCADTACFEPVVCCDAQEIFADPTIEAVVVASATETHCDYIEQAVRAGKAVFCEKPLDLNLERAARLVAFLSARSDACVQMGFNRRFDPGHRAVRDACRAGEIGELYQVVVTSRDPALPSLDYLMRSGGIFRDMTIHDLDMARFMLAEEPVEVFATASALIDKAGMAKAGDHDCAMIVLRTERGLQCLINNSRQAVYGYDQRIELLGSEGMLLSDNRRAREVRRFARGQTASGEGLLHFFTERYAESFRLQFASFFASTRSAASGRAVEVGVEDGFRALLLAECCYRSFTRGEIVKVGEVLSEYGGVSSRG